MRAAAFHPAAKGPCRAIERSPASPMLTACVLPRHRPSVAAPASGGARAAIHTAGCVPGGLGTHARGGMTGGGTADAGCCAEHADVNLYSYVAELGALLLDGDVRQDGDRMDCMDCMEGGAALHGCMAPAPGRVHAARPQRDVGARMHGHGSTVDARCAMSGGISAAASATTPAAPAPAALSPAAPAPARVPPLVHANLLPARHQREGAGTSEAGVSGIRPTAGAEVSWPAGPAFAAPSATLAQALAFSPAAVAGPARQRLLLLQVRSAGEGCRRGLLGRAAARASGGGCKGGLLLQVRAGGEGCFEGLLGTAAGPARQRLLLLRMGAAARAVLVHSKSSMPPAALEQSGGFY
eukprot:351342-Chlamydomonas_euryale.AAC.7